MLDGQHYKIFCPILEKLSLCKDHLYKSLNKGSLKL